MKSELLLTALALSGLAIRALASVPIGSERLFARLAGMVLTASAAWMLTTVCGLWTPWWPIVPMVIVGYWMSRVLPKRIARPMVDVGIMVAFGALAVPHASLAATLALAAGYALWGACTGNLLRRFRWKTSAALAGVAVVLVAACACTLWFAYEKVARYPAKLLSVGVIRVDAGAPVRLSSGSTAWLSVRPQGRPALLLHGAHSSGSNQPAAAVLRRALMDAGFSVLSLDHPGYGKSPKPAVRAPVEAWDPLPHVQEALDFLGQRFDGQPVLLVGHSMGTGDALRALSIADNISVAVLFGAALPSPSERDAYWFERFHSDRRITERMDVAKWREISTRFYDTAAAARALSSDRAPVVFVQFEHEHEDVVAGRSELFELIPPPKMQVDYLGSNHYLNTYELRGNLVLSEVSSAQQLAADMTRWIDQANALARASEISARARGAAVNARTALPMD